MGKPYDQDCAFCKIARGEAAPPTLVAEGEEWLAFFPLDPATPGHTLVIPRDHVADYWKLDDQLGATLSSACIRLGRVIEKALNPDGMNLITSAGTVAEQSVFHLHLHLVPRWDDDGFGQIWPREGHYEKSELGDAAELIRKELKGE